MSKRKWSEEEISEHRRAHNMYFFYYNEEDGNLFVPKAYVLDAFKNWPMARLTFNWAHPIAMGFALIIICTNISLFLQLTLRIACYNNLVSFSINPLYYTSSEMARLLCLDAIIFNRYFTVSLVFLKNS